MKNEQIISWIFLATALASQTRPAKLNEISMIADGINHAVPTQQELRNSLNKLLELGLVDKIEKKYELTAKGKLEHEKASRETNILITIWKNLENRFKDYA